MSSNAEVSIERPKSLDHQASTWSDYKYPLLHF